ncbi:MAG: SGNH/GDSL hydrolase family protein [Candidatus Sphingomonas phytovorans]|nr:SGNH/GDSL hydrolase family protein [Sphingomonas sp.]WEJ98415.1 MAG: SGNH/GDSL hydrolase family protein [Sphingomonas sp.]
MRGYRLYLSLAATALLLQPIAAGAQARRVWTRSWQAVPMEMPAPVARPGQPVSPPQPAPPLSADATYRMTARLSAGGTILRLRLSNEMGTAPLPVGAVHVALAGPDGGIVAGTDRAVTFGGSASPVIPAGAPLISDPVALKVAPLARIVVSIHVPGDTAHLSVHQLGVATTRIVPGNQASAPVLAPGGATSTMRYLLTAIDVAGGPATGTIVTIGDSITDGAASSKDTDRRWPDVLAERLDKAGKNGLAVANAGISGNRLLKTGAGPAALARFDRDILSVPGVRYVVILEGINDIGSAKGAASAPPTVADITGAYRQMIDRAHDRGIKVIGATVLPYKGAGYYAAEGDAVRVAVNTWIRAPGNFDGVIDFDRAVADKADPLRMAKAYDSGDALHPGDAGYRAMGEAIDLNLFR